MAAFVLNTKVDGLKFNDIVHKFNRVNNTSKYDFVHKSPKIVFVFSTSTTLLTNVLVKLAMHLSHYCNYLFSFDLYFFPTANEYSFFLRNDGLLPIWRHVTKPMATTSRQGVLSEPTSIFFLFKFFPCFPHLLGSLK